MPRGASKVINASAWFMVAWVLAPFPGSAYVDLLWHDELVHNLWGAIGFDPLIGPESLMLKYNTLGRLPSLLHAVPGALWCGSLLCETFKLSPN